MKGNFFFILVIQTYFQVQDLLLTNVGTEDY